jgi:hypothetical protein
MVAHKSEVVAHAVRIHHAAPGSVSAIHAGFLIESIRSARQAKRATGSLAVSILRAADLLFSSSVNVPP